ncbi:hypothetical protein LIER_18696 [Lithospermum erythrorhizon]|uniref:Gag-pol polyprotein n=1 Tax=Lithospermum erythrorhizon TaxID=34254 RepID=A0AAV3QFY4_LITER
MRWKCHNCGKKGHITPYCYRLYGKGRNKYSLPRKEWVQKTTIASRVVFTSLKATTCEGWYFDSGCSRHMTGKKSNLTDIKELSGSYVTFGGGAKGKITGKGIFKVEGLPNLQDVLLVDDLTVNLISISQLCDEGMRVVFSKYTWVEFLREKSNAFDVFKTLAIQIQREKALPIIRIRSDHGKKFENLKFDDYCKQEDIKHEFSTPITPQQNGIVERKNRDPKQKFDVKGEEGVFLGYSRNSRALRVYNKRMQMIMEPINVKVVDEDEDDMSDAEIEDPVTPGLDVNQFENLSLALGLCTIDK